MRLLPGIVDRNEEHIELLYGDSDEVDSKDFIPVALVAPCEGKGFIVQYTLVADDADTRMMIEEVQEELRYYLIEKGERHPWQYAHYHCGSAANWYSSVHWCWQQGRSVHSGVALHG